MKLSRLSACLLYITLMLSSLPAEGERKEAYYQSKTAPVPGEDFVIPGLDINMIWCKPGTTRMGHTNKNYAYMPIMPEHTVEFTKGFWLAETKLTIDNWKAMGFSIKHTPLEIKSPWHILHTGNEDDRFPVHSASFDDIMAFFKIMNDHPKSRQVIPRRYVYSLPTSAQWIYAHKCGDIGKEKAYPLENIPKTLPANQYDSYIDKQYGTHSQSVYGEKPPHPIQIVKSKKPNAWGFYDFNNGDFEIMIDDHIVDARIADYPALRKDPALIAKKEMSIPGSNDYYPIYSETKNAKWMLHCSGYSIGRPGPFPTSPNTYPTKCWVSIPITTFRLCLRPVIKDMDTRYQ